MNNLTKIVLFTMSLIYIMAGNSYSQSDITFKVNLRPQLEDSIFIPGRDHVYLKGDIFPLSQSRKVYLKDVAPIDSIYQTTVNFSSSANNERLTYNFFIQTPEELKKEQQPRYIQISSKDRELDALYFNSFAW